MPSDDGLQDSIERARQAFRSANEARPLILRRDDSAAPATPVPAAASVLHPFFRGLLETLPDPGTLWPQAQRDQWLETARHIFALIYSDTDSRPLDHPPASIQYDQGDSRVS